MSLLDQQLGMLGQQSDPLHMQNALAAQQSSALFGHPHARDWYNSLSTIETMEMELKGWLADWDKTEE